LFKIAGPAAEGVIAFSNPTAEFLPAAKTFSEAYTKQYNAAPGPYSTLSYDAMKLLAWAITTAGTTDAPKVIETLQGANFTDTISGPISFTPEKTLARSNFVVLEGKGGAWTLAQ
jgi:branched-chain amino acid transport system substrate-binding protein